MLSTILLMMILLDVVHTLDEVNVDVFGGPGEWATILLAYERTGMKGQHPLHGTPN